MVRRLATRMASLLVAATVTLAVAPEPAAADARSRYLVRLLEGSSQFRVRTQAAISLVKVGDEAGVVQALRQALRDSHPAVRAAAARSLGQLEARAAQGDLQATAKDPEAPVRAACTAALARIATRGGGETPKQQPTMDARYYVAVGTPGSRVDGVEPGVLSQAKGVLRSKLATVDGVQVAPDGETNSQARRLLAQRKLKGFYIDSSITSVQKRPGGGIRVVVSLIVATYPGRDMRAILHGAATAMGSGGHTTFSALEGAISGALRQLPAALAQ